eukprot:5819173-Amphidinium_carterae.1
MRFGLACRVETTLIALHSLAAWFPLARLAAATASTCPTGYERSIYGPFTSTSQDLLACSVLFDIDIRKHFEPELQQRFGPPVVNIAVVHNNSRIKTQMGTSDSNIATGVRTTLNWFQGIGDASR